jgi:hypothetical protein
MKLNENQSLERILESAIVVSWADLMRGAQTGLIHIEYGFALDGSLEYLKILSSLTRGHWLLVCQYWMSASMSHSSGVRYDNGYRSEGLARMLEFIMRHQDTFSVPPDLGREGLLQIQTPTEEEISAAVASISEAFDRIGFAPAQPALA